jgi:chorismate-pyruvate lyase
MRIRPCIAVLGALLWPSAAVAQDLHPWPDSFVGRLEVFALIEQLNGELLASRSATATLESWCADHRMAASAHVTAILARNAGMTPTLADRSALQLEPGEQFRYRHVRLACGGHVLSEADNWYVPSRLTPDMNRQLETTDAPFGRAVQDLHPVRQTLSVERLWSPLPQNWDRSSQRAGDRNASKGDLAIPPFLFRHHAILFDAQRRPIALVVESYTRETLHFSRR